MARAITGILLVGLLWAAPASAQEERGTLVPVTVEGHVRVQFNADAASGCQGTCGLSGTVMWSLPSSAILSVYEERHAGKLELEGYLLFFGIGDSGPTTTAQVSRGPGAGAAGVCSDIRRATALSLDFSAGERTRLQARLTSDDPVPYAAASLLETRCGGPLDRDVEAALPVQPIDLATLLRGGATVDLSGERAFLAGGFAGTLRSTVKLELGKPFAPFRPVNLGRPEPTPREPRIVSATYRVERVTGSVLSSFSGSGEQLLCAPLDVCNSSGTVRIAPLAESGSATILAFAGDERTSHRQLRAALGLAPGRRARGIRTYGDVTWARDSGTVSGSFTAGGSTCTDSAPLRDGWLTLSFGRRRVFASYGRVQPYREDVFRTRCPGPAIADAAHDHPLAAGAVKLRAFRRKRVVIRLHGRRPFDSAPYRGETVADLTVVLRRLRVHRDIEGDVLVIR